MSTDLVHVPRQLPAPPSERFLAVDVATYLLNKKKRLTAKSEIGYRMYLRILVDDFPDHTLTMFEPPTGTLLPEDFVTVTP